MTAKNKDEKRIQKSFKPKKTDKTSKRSKNLPEYNPRRPLFAEARRGGGGDPPPLGGPSQFVSDALVRPGRDAGDRYPAARPRAWRNMYVYVYFATTRWSLHVCMFMLAYMHCIQAYTITFI